MSTAPGGSTTSPTGVCVECPNGSLEVIVWHHLICWETPETTGLLTRDEPFEGVTVRLLGHDEINPETTGSDGKVKFTALLPGSYVVAAEKPGYEDCTDELRDIHDARQPPLPFQLQLRDSADVQVDNTANCDVVLRLKPARLNPDGTWTEGRECKRRHTTKLLGVPGFSLLTPMFWSNEPGMLFARDSTFVILLVMAVLLPAVGIPLGMGFFPIYASVFLAAIVAYLTGVIFGKIAGTIAITAAFVAFCVALAGMILILAYGSPEPADMVLMFTFAASGAGMWSAFGTGWLPGRKDVWDGTPNWFTTREFWMPAGVSFIIAAVFLIFALFAMAAAGANPDGILVLIAIILTAFLSILFGGLAGLAGYAFANEGQVREWGITDLKLPFTGERYCLQGARGFWSHVQQMEGSYDFSMPDNTDVISAKPGHIIAFDDRTRYRYLRPLHEPEAFHHLEFEPPEQREPSFLPDMPPPSEPTAWETSGAGFPPYGTSMSANYISVRHKDGSVANYSGMMTNGITGERWSPRLHEVGDPRGDWRVVGRDGFDNPLHVWQGDVLGGCGWTDSDRPERDRSFPNRPAWHWFFLGWLFALGLTAIVIFLGETSWQGFPPNQGGWGGHVDGFCPPAGVSTGDVEVDAKCAEFRTDPEKGMVRVENGRVVETLLPDHLPFDADFCERLTGGSMEQPWSAISALAFVPFALIFLGLFCAGGTNGLPHKNRMTVTTDPPVVLSMILIFNGPGAMFFHASFLHDFSWLDSWSMDFFASFVITYNVVRMANLPRWGFWLMFLLLAVASVPGAMGLYGMPPVGWFALMVGTAYITQILVAFNCNITTDTAGMAWFWTGQGSFVLGLVIWYLGHTGQAACQIGGIGSPDASWGHPVWHLLGAFAMFCFAMYFRHQIDPEPCWPRLHMSVLEAPQPGPPITEPEPQLQPGATRRDSSRYLTVKFDEPATAILDANQPRSMRKYLSTNGKLTAPVISEIAFLNPSNGGTHPVEQTPGD